MYQILQVNKYNNNIYIYILDNNMRIFSSEVLILGNKMLEYICTNFIFHTLLDSWILAPNLYHRKLQANLRTWVTHFPKFNNVPFLGSSVKQYTTTNRELWLNTNQKFASTRSNILIEWSYILFPVGPKYQNTIHNKI